VNENVWAVLLLDEPKTLGVVEPLHGVIVAQKNAAPLVFLRPASDEFCLFRAVDPCCIDPLERE
jgi:hypothetical protein